MITTVLLGLALVPVIGWLLFFYSRDRYEREPKRLIINLFLLGFGAIAVAIVGNRLVSDVALDRVRFGPEALSVVAFPRALLYVAGIAACEEGAKLAFAWSRVRRDPEFTERVDGMIYLTTVALGFAALENFDYIAGTFGGTLAGGRVSVTSVAEIATLRPVTSTLGHVAWSGICGYFLARHVVDRRPFIVVPASFLAAVGLHALYDASFHVTTALDAPYQVRLLSGLPVIVVSVFIYAVLFRKALADSPHRREQVAVAPETS